VFLILSCHITHNRYKVRSQPKLDYNAIVGGTLET